MSETNKPIIDWVLEGNIKTIHSYFRENGFGKPDRYGDSFIYKSYDTESLPGSSEFEQDLEFLIDKYKNTDSQKRRNE